MAKRQTAAAESPDYNSDLPPELREDFPGLPGEIATAPTSQITAEQVLGEQAQRIAEQTRMPDEHGNGHPVERGARKSWKDRSKKKGPNADRPMNAVTIGDLRVERFDNFHEVGIKLSTTTGRRVTPEETAIVTDAVNAPTTTTSGKEIPSDYRRDFPKLSWLKEIPPMDKQREAQDVGYNTRRRVAIDLDSERRFKQVVEGLQDHHDIATGHADRVEARRAEAADRDRIPN